MLAKGPVQAIVLLALAGMAIYTLFLALHRWHYSRPKPFAHNGVRYIWTRDPACPFWVRQFRRGHFHHPDGTPVTDPALARTLQQSWLIEHSRTDIHD